MKYMLLIYADEKAFEGMTQEQGMAMMQAHTAFQQKHHDRISGGEALDPTSTATTVRIRDGRVLTTDGPFAETKEALGGFYFVDAPDLDTALAIAADIPGTDYGSIEVRPVMQIPSMP